MSNSIDTLQTGAIESTAYRQSRQSKIQRGITSENIHSFPMNSEELAQYMEATHSTFKPWLLAQLRLKKLQERKHKLSAIEYEAELADIHQDLLNLGEWWVGREDEVFGK